MTASADLSSSHPTSERQRISSALAQNRRNRDYLVSQQAEARRLGLSSQAARYTSEFERVDANAAKLDALAKNGNLSRARAPSKADRERRLALSPAGAARGRDHAVLVGRAVVACPFNGNDRIQVSINRRVDVLAQERAAGRITEAQFLVGRTIQAVFERSSGARMGSGGWNAGGSRDQTVAHELQIIYAIEDAATVQAYVERMTKTIGAVGVRFLRAILSEGQTFTAYAERTGKGGGDRAASDIAKRFRWLLEALTEAEHTATGADGQLIRGTREPA